jgi:transcriptional regulator with XRE-family HTH domain
MGTVDRAIDRGRHDGRASRSALGSELRTARLAAGLGQRQVARASGLSQSMVSRTERGLRPEVTLDQAARLCAALGLRLHLRAYPAGPPVRDAAQLRLLARLRSQVSQTYSWHTEVPVDGRGDLRAWDVVLEGPTHVGIDAETRLHDLQAVQRRTELKLRDSRVDVAVLLLAATRHNRAVLREHRAALLSTFPLETRVVLRTLRAGEVLRSGGIVLL